LRLCGENFLLRNTKAIISRQGAKNAKKERQLTNQRLVLQTEKALQHQYLSLNLPLRSLRLGGENFLLRNTEAIISRQGAKNAKKERQLTNQRLVLQTEEALQHQYLSLNLPLRSLRLGGENFCREIPKPLFPAKAPRTQRRKGN